MRTFTIVCLTAGIALVSVSAQKPAATPYKLGTFMQGDRAFLGLVVSDRTVIDLSKADPSMPTEMKALAFRKERVARTMMKAAASGKRRTTQGRLEVIAKPPA